jgi:hypothetical protein
MRPEIITNDHVSCPQRSRRPLGAWLFALAFAVTIVTFAPAAVRGEPARSAPVTPATAVNQQASARAPSQPAPREDEDAERYNKRDRQDETLETFEGGRLVIIGGGTLLLIVLIVLLLA